MAKNLAVTLSKCNVITISVHTSYVFHCQYVSKNKSPESVVDIGSYTSVTPFNGPFSGTTRVSRYQKGKTNLDFTEARDSE